MDLLIRWVCGARIVCLAVLLLVASTTQSRAQSKTPLFADPSFDSAEVSDIDIYQMNLSGETDKHAECIGGALFAAENSLYRRGYNKSGRKPEQRFFAALINPTEEMLSNPTKEWLHDLGDITNKKQGKKWVPTHVPTSRWTLILALDELGSRDNAIKGLGEASLSIYLYDRTQATLVWKDRAEKKMWGGILGNVIEKGDLKRDTCEQLTSYMVMKLPKHKKDKEE